MESRASFKEVGSEFLRGTTANTIDTGYITTPVTSTTTNGPTLRGVETNTARGVKGTPVVGGITKLEYGSNADAPEVVGYKTYGDL
jgi:hypothetical protein